MNLDQALISDIQQAFKELYNYELAEKDVLLQPTRKDFEGSITLVTFSYGKISGKKPDETATQIGQYLLEHSAYVGNYNVVKGFLNLVLSDQTWLSILNSLLKAQDYSQAENELEKIVIEYSSPNTNKPLHLGHMRNNFLGFSVGQILKANGHEVKLVNLVNDRGIHICKSMLAYKKFGNAETPASSQTKGDHLIGKYYVEFDKQYKKQIDLTWNSLAQQANVLTAGTAKQTLEALQAKGKDITEADKESLTTLKQLKDKAEKQAPLMQEAQQMLQAWEAGDSEVRQLWQLMNGWVYQGFEQTYKAMGVAFDKFYYESNTYLLGKDMVEEGLQKGIFYKKEDGSVWIDLTEEGLDHKLVLRADGTSVYITQDMGTADLKYKEWQMDKSIIVVGNEQDHHFKVLFKILEKLGKPYAGGNYHLSYGMVDLPSGKMKSREGTVVDADDLMREMKETAANRTQELGKIDDFTAQELSELYHTLGMGALKYYLLRVDPKKRMMFNPEESIDFQGNTGPFIQYTYARIASLMRRAKQLELDWQNTDIAQLEALHPAEQDLVNILNQFGDKIKLAGKDLAPSVICQYVYDVAKEFNRFYTELSVFGAETDTKKLVRVALSGLAANTIKACMNLLGIEVPERM